MFCRNKNSDEVNAPHLIRIQPIILRIASSDPGKQNTDRSPGSPNILRCRSLFLRWYHFIRGFAPLFRLMTFLTPRDLPPRFPTLGDLLGIFFPKLGFFPLPTAFCASSRPRVIARPMTPCVFPTMSATLEHHTFLDFSWFDDIAPAPTFSLSSNYFLIYSFIKCIWCNTIHTPLSQSTPSKSWNNFHCRCNFIHVSAT